nr:hypothetical protein [uncultured Aquabacterium sp.]
MKSKNHHRTFLSVGIAIIFAALAAGSGKDNDNKTSPTTKSEPEVDRSTFAQFQVGEELTLSANSIGCYSSRDLDKVAVYVQDGREAEVEELIRDKDCNLFHRSVNVTYVEYPHHPKGPVWIQLPSGLNIFVYEAFLKRKGKSSGNH